MFVRKLLAAFWGILIVAPALADVPQPVVIQSQTVFPTTGTGATSEGTFTATAPLCTSGTHQSLRLVANPSRSHGWTVDAEYTCDDNSGTFLIQYHPQAGSNYAGGTPNSDFTLTGPWSILRGTGRYATLTGHGDFGVVINFSTTPVTAVETFVGFVQLK
jgi:hypothetical protein